MEDIIKYDLRWEGLRKSYDTTYFKKIDTHEKAYWLGFIYADGNVHKKTLQISIVDKGHLDKFKSHIKSEHAMIIDNNRNKHGYVSSNRFAITRQELVDDLAKLGVTERKSLTLTFPTEEMVPYQYINSFMLGFFDGDGSVCIYQPKSGNKKCNFSLIAPRDFCDKYNKILSKECDMFESTICKYKRIPDKDIWEIHICGVYTDKFQRIYNFLYKDIDFALERKRERFINFIATNPKEPYKSQYYGVAKHSKKKYMVRLKIKGIRFTKCGFNSEIEAAKYFDTLIIDNNMDKRWLNFPNE